MAVYERTWRSYEGPYTSLPWRFLVITRYALKDAFASRVFTGFYVLCVMPSILCMATIYLSHNLGLLQNIGLTKEFMATLVLSFLHWLFLVQAVPAFLLAVIVSPSLIAADLSNAALPLYLCRPITRAQYVIGKMAVVGILLSPVTWIAGLLNYGLQAYMTGEGWWHQHYRIALAYIVGHLAWILVVSLLSLAVSAWVRHKWIARGVLLAMLFISWAFASLVNAVVDTEWGTMINLIGVVWLVVRHLFNPTITTPIPVWAAWGSLAALAGFSLGLLHLKLRAYEEIPMTGSDRILCREVSKFYGEVLGVKRVNLDIPPGLTSLVGPNGSGKSTLMHLLTGLLRPSRGEISLLGLPTTRPEELFTLVGYCAQYDSFPNGCTGLGFLTTSVALHGVGTETARKLAWEALERVGLEDAAKRRIAGYSKGMRQRIKLAHAFAHDPGVLILDEPLNGLDPMARAEMIALMRDFASDDRHVIVSSHILHEVDQISDRVIMIHGGSVLAEGEIPKVRGEITRHPIQVLIRCDHPSLLATRLFELDHVVEVKVLEQDQGLLVRTRDAEAFFGRLNHFILDTGVDIETVIPADESIHAVYDYLIGNDGGGS